MSVVKEHLNEFLHLSEFLEECVCFVDTQDVCTVARQQLLQRSIADRHVFQPSVIHFRVLDQRAKVLRMVEGPVG